MKKLILLTMSLLPVVAHGTTVCAVNNSYIAVFKKTLTSGTLDYSSDGTTKTWQVTMADSGANYSKTVTGVAACNEVTGTRGTAKTNLYTTPSDVGQYCWCKLEPVEAYGYETGIASYWVFNKTYTDAASCASGCATQCGNDMASTLDSSFRSSILEAIW